MLNPVTQLAQYTLGNISGGLGTEKHTYTFGTNKTDNLLDLSQKGFGCTIEQKVCLIKEKDQLGLAQPAPLGEVVDQGAQEPYEKGGKHKGRRWQRGGVQQGDAPFPIRLPNEIIDLNCLFSNNL